jgi:hypothetical protein
MAINRSDSIDLIINISEYLNRIIITSGPIKINNRDIWHNTLNCLNNQHWDGILETLTDLMVQNPQLGNPGHRTAITSARIAIATSGAKHQRILDTKPYKTVAWRALMSMRELYCETINIQLPNGEIKNGRNSKQH